MSLKSQKCARQLFIRLLGEETALLTGEKALLSWPCAGKGGVKEGGRKMQV